MPANKMPEFAWPLKFYDVNGKPVFMKHQLAAAIDAYGRACYLAGIADARACVPEEATSARNQIDRFGQGQFNRCREETLANLTALEQEAKK